MIGIVTRFSGEFDFLSNFFPAEVMVDGLNYRSVEHGYQASKTESIVDRLHIREAKSPGEAKAIGGRLVGLRLDWEAIKDGVMLGLLEQKFAVDPLRARLEMTGDDMLVEANPWGDVYWGVCNGVGRNVLGMLLMDVRQANRVGR